MTWWIVVIFLGLPALAVIYDRWPRKGWARYEHEHDKLLLDMRARGLSPKDQDREMAFRLSMTRLRRLASDAVVRDPSRYREIIDSIAKAESDRMKGRDRAAARQFLGVVSESQLSEILYPDALAAIDRHNARIIRQIARKRPAMPDQDVAASVRTE